MTAAVDASASFDFVLPPELEAREPIEARGGSRDGVRLLVSNKSNGGLSNRSFCDFPDLLSPGDVLVVNDSATLPAAVDLGDGASVHFSTPAPDSTTGHTWLVELRSCGERFAGDPATGVLDLPGGHRLVLLGRAAGDRLWRAKVLDRRGAPVTVESFLATYGRPIRYRYVDRPWPLTAYQTVFARKPGSAEMPSAGRPFTHAVVTRLTARGVTVVPITLHTGVASPEADEPPYSERFRVSAATASAIAAARSRGGRVVAVGTTVVRALESAADADGVLHPTSGWTDLVITAERGVRVVDGLLSGFHEPRATHLAMLEAVSGSELVARTYAEAIRGRYSWHEFGDVNLYL